MTSRVPRPLEAPKSKEDPAVERILKERMQESDKRKIQVELRIKPIRDRLNKINQ